MRARRAARSVAAVLVVVIALSGCTTPSSGDERTTTPAPVGSAAPSANASEPTTFVSVVDGDTIETSEGTVRIIGIDTPERGECGNDRASAAIAAVLASGDSITLELPPGQNDQDRHGRLIRYVTTDTGIDLGLLQLESGHAVARYDSLDGYPTHPREADYHAAQLASLGPDGSVVTVVCQELAPSTADGWWKQYTSCAKLKKNDVGHPTGPFNRDDPAQAEAYDWFAHRTGNNGDGDGDGLACE